MPQTAYNAGFEKFSFADPAGRAVHCALWYPAAAAESELLEGPWRFRVAVGAEPVARHCPLIVLSHGTASSWREHHDTAEFLARRGFVVAGISHPGDSYDYPEKDFGGLRSSVTRPGHISRLLDHLLQAPRFAPSIDAGRIAVFGFSIGGYTAFVLAGARPDFNKLASHPADDPPSIYFSRSAPERRALAEALLQAPPPAADPRVRAILVMAPALGFLFDAAGLQAVRLPARLYRAEHDQVLRHPHDGETYRRLLPGLPESTVVAGAGHYVFLAPPPPSLARTIPEVFKDSGGFDRRAFHQTLNQETESFFAAALG